MFHEQAAMMQNAGRWETCAGKEFFPHFGPWLAEHVDYFVVIDDYRYAGIHDANRWIRARQAR